MEGYNILKRTIIKNFLFVVADIKFGITCCVDSGHRKRHMTESAGLQEEYVQQTSFCKRMFTYCYINSSKNAFSKNRLNVFARRTYIQLFLKIFNEKVRIAAKMNKLIETS